jgi:hypothetical protein
MLASPASAHVNQPITGAWHAYPRPCLPGLEPASTGGQSRHTRAPVSRPPWLLLRSTTAICICELLQSGKLPSPKGCVLPSKPHNKTAKRSRAHFNPDVAIGRASDRLDRQPLAKHLADLIRSYDDDPALFVGVLGPWGSGKTSFLNMLEEELSSHDYLSVSWLRPWLLGSTGELLKAAFATIVKNSGGRGGLTKRGMQKLRRFGAAVLRGTTLSASGGGDAGAPGVEASFDLGRIMDQLEAGEGEQIETLKGDAAACLKKSKRKTVVLVDDSDRLEAAEIRELLRVLRAALDLPNIIFVIGGDEHILTKAIESGVATSDSTDALAKFLQVVVPLPKPTLDQIRQLALVNMEALRGRLAQYGSDLSSSEWDELKDDLDSHTIDLFRTPRDVVRWANSCLLPLMHLHGEINRADLCLLYAIRLVAPTAYNYLWEQREAFLGLIGSGRKYYSQNSLPTRKEEFVKGFVEAVGVAHPDAEALLHRLLGRSLQGYNQEALVAEQRLGSSEYFLIAFSLTVGAAGISDRTVSAILNAAASDDVLLAGRILGEAMTLENWFALTRSVARRCSDSDVSAALKVCSVLLSAVTCAAQWPAQLPSIQDGVDRMLRSCVEPFRETLEYHRWLSTALLDESLTLGERIRLGFDLLSDYNQQNQRVWVEMKQEAGGTAVIPELTKQCVKELGAADRSDQHWHANGICLMWVAFHDGIPRATDIVVRWLASKIVTVGDLLGYFGSTVTSSAQRAPYRVFTKRNYDGLCEILDPQRIADVIAEMQMKPASVKKAMQAERERRNISAEEMVALFLAFQRGEQVIKSDG